MNPGDLETAHNQMTINQGPTTRSFLMGLFTLTPTSGDHCNDDVALTHT